MKVTADVTCISVVTMFLTILSSHYRCPLRTLVITTFLPLTALLRNLLVRLKTLFDAAEAKADVEARAEVPWAGLS